MADIVVGSGGSTSSPMVAPGDMRGCAHCCRPENVAGQCYAGPLTSVHVKLQRSSIDLLVRVTYRSNLPPWEEKAQGVGFYGGSAVQVVNAPGLFYSF